MLFNSPLFLFLFFPLTWLAYHLSPRAWRNGVLLVASLWFYAWAEPRFLLVAAASALADWWIGQKLIHSSREAHGRRWLLLGIAINLGILIYYKYAGFTWTNLGFVLKHFGITLPVLRIALPIAVSFITFEKIAYLVDIYRNKTLPERQLHRYFLFVFLFPKLLAGPIIRFGDIQAQIAQRSAGWEDLRYGLLRFLIGLGKKVLVADTIGQFTDQIFRLPYDRLNTTSAWLGVFCFSIQIYFDFAGYSDMAIGLSRIFGFHLKENFNQPYIADSFTDFWRRWHISLSSWIRDYIYFPLGGSRLGVGRTYLNLSICFFLSGLWHGAAWTFIVWGTYHGIFMLAERLFLLRWKAYLPRLVNVLVTFALVTVSRVFFRSASIDQAFHFLRSMFTPVSNGLRPVTMNTEVFAALVFGALVCFLPLMPRFEELRSRLFQIRWRPELELAAAYLVFVLAIAKVTTSSYQAFIYFRF